MRRKYYTLRVLVSFCWVILLLVAAWYISGKLYRPDIPKPTQASTATRSATYTPTATQQPETPTRTPEVIPPTDKPTETQEPTETQTPAPSVTLAPVETTAPAPLPILYDPVQDSWTGCVTFFIRPWGIKTIMRCPDPTP